MPTNLDALLRYHTIDKCLQNRFRKWTWEALAEKCTEALEESGHRPNGKATISKRTIQGDISVMRSSKLGYNAPIVAEDGCYFYKDKDYSIRNVSLRKKDIATISAAIAKLKVYKGLPFFQNIESMLSRIEGELQVQKAQTLQSFILFENIPPSKGTQWLEQLIEFIADSEVLKLTYRKFNAEHEKTYTFHPYFLKEYHNRWYVIGWYEEEGYLKTFALDRIQNLEVDLAADYNREQRPDPSTLFDHTIGVSFLEDEPQEVLLRFYGEKIPYIKSQRLHESQVEVEETAGSITVSLRVCLNYELESLILSFADEVEVLKPDTLKQKVQKRLELALKRFSTPEKHL